MARVEVWFALVCFALLCSNGSAGATQTVCVSVCSDLGEEIEKWPQNKQLSEQPRLEAQIKAQLPAANVTTMARRAAHNRIDCLYRLMVNDWDA